jgi:hypothetical protein
MSEKGKPLKKKKDHEKPVTLVEAPVAPVPAKKGDKKS